MLPFTIENRNECISKLQGFRLTDIHLVIANFQVTYNQTLAKVTKSCSSLKLPKYVFKNRLHQRVGMTKGDDDLTRYKLLTYEFYKNLHIVPNNLGPSLTSSSKTHISKNRCREVNFDFSLAGFSDQQVQMKIRLGNSNPFYFSCFHHLKS